MIINTLKVIKTMNLSPKRTFEICSEKILKDIRELKKFSFENYLVEDYEDFIRDVYYEQ